MSKSWDNVQIFFIYDTEHCQREEDDPNDSILYFHPPKMSDNLIHILTSQLMGVLTFMKTFGTVPTKVNLQRGCFAFHVVGKYALVLAGSPDMPDSVLQKQLHDLYAIFTFYYKSFDAVFEKCESARDVFIERLRDIFNIVLQLSQHHGNTVSLTFDIVPTAQLADSEDRADIEQKCSEFFDGVWKLGLRNYLGGILIFDNMIVKSSLPTDLTRMIQHIAPGCSPLPVTVDVKEMSCLLPEAVKFYLIYLDNSTILNLISKEAEERVYFDEPDVAPGRRTSRAYHSPSGTPSSTPEPPGSPKLERLLETISIDDDKKEKVPNKEEKLSDKKEKLSENKEKLPEEGASSSSSSSNTRSSTRGKKREKSEAGAGEPAPPPPNEELVPCYLYTQSHSRMSALVLFHLGLGIDEEFVGKLWQHCLSVIGDLEPKVANSTKDSPQIPIRKETPKGPPPQREMLYSTEEHTLVGDVPSPWSNTMEEATFCRSTQLLHETLAANPEVSSLTVHTDDHVIHGERTDTEENYRQLPSPPRTDLGLPNPHGVFANISRPKHQ